MTGVGVRKSYDQIPKPKLEPHPVDPIIKAAWSPSLLCSLRTDFTVKMCHLS